MIKVVIRGGLYATYLAIIVYAVLYFGFWTTYRDNLLQLETPESIRERLEPPRHIDADTMRLLGSVYQEKASSFVNFEQAKPAGTTRVCALGDSNTQGDEVGTRHDYPSYLQRLFEQRGFDRVQVLNFGNGWFGFSQIYVMWKNVASKFDCDYVLLLPMRFWLARDITFNHTRGLFPSYLHARLVLEDDDLRLIAPVGATAEERLDEYVRAIPHWQYLRYDRHPPNILNSPLPDGRNLPNPFYYDLRPGAEELIGIYARIIRSIADDGPQLAVVFRGIQQDLYPELVSPGAPDIGVVLLANTRKFPYVAPAGHASPWGQELTALAFFELLTGGTEKDFTLAGVENLSAPADTAPEPLHSYRQVWLEYMGKRSAYFVKRGDKSQYNHQAHIRLFRQQKIAALLSLSTAGNNIADGCLLPLREVPAGDSELVLERDNGDRLPIGTIDQVQPDVAIFSVTVPADFNSSCLPSAVDGTANQLPGSLMLNGSAVARIDGKRIEPTHASLLNLRDSGEHLSSMESLIPPGVINVVLKSDDGKLLRRPLLAIDKKVSRDYLQIRQPVRHVIGSDRTD